MPAITIDLPDELLAKLDRLARWRRTTREALLTDAATAELDLIDEIRRERSRALLADLPPQDGQATRWIREMRGTLVSCDMKDLVRPRHAITPKDVVALTATSAERPT